MLREVNGEIPACGSELGWGVKLDQQEERTEVVENPSNRGAQRSGAVCGTKLQ